MPAILSQHDSFGTSPLSTRLRRYCGDWLAQFFWAIENDLEEPVNLYAPARPHTPRARGVLDRREGKIDPNLYLKHPRVAGPQLLAYVCYLPAETRFDFEGKRVYLNIEEVAQIRQVLKERGLLGTWEAYRQGGSYQIYAYHRASGSMQLTPKARATQGVAQVADMLADWFARQVLQDD